MTATNHALTGALIGLSVSSPLLAVVLAFGSHFVLDGVPHYEGAKRDVASKRFAGYLVLEALVCSGLVATLFLAHPERWLLASICAFTATSPDFMWTNSFLQAHKTHNYVPPTYALARFHAWVQWFEHPSGAIVEIVWAVMAIFLLVKLV